MSDEDKTTWLIAARAHRAERRLELQSDLNCGFFPDANKHLRMWIAGVAYDEDDPRYVSIIESLARGK